MSQLGSGKADMSGLNRKVLFVQFAEFEFAQVTLKVTDRVRAESNVPLQYRYSAFQCFRHPWFYSAFLLYPGAPPRHRPNRKYPGALKCQFLIPSRSLGESRHQMELTYAHKQIYLNIYTTG